MSISHFVYYIINNNNYMYVPLNNPLTISETSQLQRERNGHSLKHEMEVTLFQSFCIFSWYLEYLFAVLKTYFTSITCYIPSIFIRYPQKFITHLRYTTLFTSIVIFIINYVYQPPTPTIKLLVDSSPIKLLVIGRLLRYLFEFLLKYWQRCTVKNLLSESRHLSNFIQSSDVS